MPAPFLCFLYPSVADSRPGAGPFGQDSIIELGFGADGYFLNPAQHMTAAQVFVNGTLVWTMAGYTINYNGTNELASFVVPAGQGVQGGTGFYLGGGTFQGGMVWGESFIAASGTLNLYGTSAISDGLAFWIRLVPSTLFTLSSTVSVRVLASNSTGTLDVTRTFTIASSSSVSERPRFTAISPVGTVASSSRTVAFSVAPSPTSNAKIAYNSGANASVYESFLGQFQLSVSGATTFLFDGLHINQTTGALTSFPNDTKLATVSTVGTGWNVGAKGWDSIQISATITDDWLPGTYTILAQATDTFDQLQQFSWSFTVPASAGTKVPTLFTEFVPAGNTLQVTSAANVSSFAGIGLMITNAGNFTYDDAHSRLYSNEGNNTIDYYSNPWGANTQSSFSVPLPFVPFSMAAAWTAKKLFIGTADPTHPNIKVYSSDTHTDLGTDIVLLDTASASDSPWTMVVDQVKQQLWVFGTTANPTIYCIDIVSGSVLLKLSTVSSGPDLVGYAFDATNSRAYIIDDTGTTGRMRTVNTSTHSVVATQALATTIDQYVPADFDSSNSHVLAGRRVLTTAGAQVADLSGGVANPTAGDMGVWWDNTNHRILYWVPAGGAFQIYSADPVTFTPTGHGTSSFAPADAIPIFFDPAGAGAIAAGGAAALTGGLVGHGSLAADLTAPGALGAAAPISIPSAAGEVPLILHPQKSVYLRPKSTTASIDPTTFHFEAGFSNVIHKSLLPEADVTLPDYGATVILDTIEHRAPVTGQVPITLSSGSLVFTKGTNNTADIGIYEIKIPVTNKAACLGYFKFRTKTAWTRFSPDWINTSNMIGMVFGLEHGSFNTAAYMFLRDDGANGSLIVGGPMQTFGAGRPGQAEISGFDWLSFPDNSIVEFYIFFNPKGHSPSYTPVVEFWTKGPLDTAPVKEAFVPISDLGTYPSLSSNSFNSRSGPSDYLTLYFGNTGRTGDVLQLDDWQLYQDFQVAADLGAPSANNIFDHLPDAPVMYRAADGVLPEELVPGRWYIPDPGLVPTSSFHYQPSVRSRPDLLEIDKEVDDISNRMIYQKKEPRLSHSGDGFMVEGYISVNKTSQITLGGSGTTFEGTGMGFGVCDGVNRFEIMGIDTGAVRTLGLVKNQGRLDVTSLGFYTPTNPVDLSNPVLCRLSTDYSRGKIEVFAGDMTTPIISRFSIDTFPLDSGPSMVFFGHIEGTPTKGILGVKSLTYLPRYKVYEAVDGSAPNFPWVAHISGAGTASVVSQRLVVNKSDINTVNSKVYYTYASSFAEQGGCLVDFNAQVIGYKSVTGQLWPKLAQLGAGVRLNLGNKVLALDFFDCGAGGRRIGIVPGSGSASDIINQTLLGLSFSAPVDWTQIQSYRIVLRANDSIKIYVGSPTSDPLITIPWTSSGFDLPLDGTAVSLNIGHFDQNTSSSVTWGYVRWGVSNGYEMALTRDYPDGVRPSYFGGKYLITSTFSETS